MSLKVSLRAIDISSNAFDDVLQSTDVELVRFCGGPGASADALQVLLNPRLVGFIIHTY